MVYADFNYYANVYLGDLITEEEEYERLAVRAGIELEYYTFDRVKDHQDDDRVMMAACAVAEQLASAHRAAIRSASAEGEIQSETVGGFSRTYRANSDVAAKAKSEIRAVVAKYLANTGLMYRGIY